MDKEKKLNEKQEQFCLIYVSKEFFANGVESYAEAYGLDIAETGNYNTCKSNAYKLLTNTYILKRIDELLELSGLTDQFVDKQLLFVITQNADLGSKTAAIREYNKLKVRILDKLKDKDPNGDFDITLKI